MMRKKDLVEGFIYGRNTRGKKEEDNVEGKGKNISRNVNVVR